MTKQVIDLRRESQMIKKIASYIDELLAPLEDHYYHHYGHALEVMNRAVYLGLEEGVSKENLEILKIAALFHDTGFVMIYEKNEPFGAKIAENFLKMQLYFPKEKIETVRRLILATDPDYLEPQDILEKIIKDSDMDNLGTNEFLNYSERIKKELEAIQKIKISDPEWHHRLLDTLYKHKFYTRTEKRERGINKIENLKLVKKLQKK